MEIFEQDETGKISNFGMEMIQAINTIFQSSFPDIVLGKISQQPFVGQYKDYVGFTRKIV